MLPGVIDIADYAQSTEAEILYSCSTATEITYTSWFILDLAGIKEIDLDEHRPDCSGPVIPLFGGVPEELLDAGFADITGVRLEDVVLSWNNADTGNRQVISLWPIESEDYVVDPLVFFANKGETLEYSGNINAPAPIPVSIGTLDDNHSFYVDVDTTFDAGWNALIAKFTSDNNEVIITIDIVPLHTLSWEIIWANPPL